MRQLLTKSNQLFWSFTAGFLLGWIAHLSRAEFMLRGMHNYLQVLSLFSFSFCAFLTWTHFRQHIPRLPMTYFKAIGILVVAASMFLANAAILFQYTGRFLGPVVKDLMPIACILCGPALGLFTVRQRVIFGSLFLVVLAVAVFTVLRVNVNVVAMAANRAEAFEEVGIALLYSFQVSVGASAAMLLLYFMTTTRSLWLTLCCAGGMLFWLYTSLVYSKRQGLLEFAVIGAAIGLILLLEKGRNIRRLRGYLISGAVLLSFVGITFMVRSDALGVMLDRVVSRFTDIRYGGIENVDRFQEASGYLASTDWLRIIFGQGMGGFSFEVISMHVIHMGWVNLIFKGGVILALFYLIALSWNLFYLLGKPRFPNRLLVAFLCAYLMFRMLYSPAWGFLPSAIFLGLTFFAPEVFLASDRLRQREASRPAPFSPRPGPFQRSRPMGGYSA